MTWTAESLDAATRDCRTEPWWPEGLVIYRDPIVGPWCRLDGAVVEARNAAAIIAEAVLRALAERGLSPCVQYGPPAPLWAVACGTGRQQRDTEADTLLEALLAAWRACRAPAAGGRDGA